MRCLPIGRAPLAAPVLLSFALLTACAGDGPTSPGAERSPTSAPRPSASYASTWDGTTITLWADDGRAYTLDGVRSRVLVSDGTVIELNASELAAATSSFIAAYEADRAASSVTNLAPPSNPDCELGLETCDRQWDFAEGALGFGPEGGVVAPPAQSFVVRRATSDTAPDVVAADPDLPWAAPQYFSCEDIGQAIYDATVNYRAKRGAVLGVFLSALSFKVMFTAEGGTTIKLASIQGLAGKLETAAYDEMTATTQLNVLAGLYASYGCWTSAWGSAGIVGSTSVAVSPIVQKVCHAETWIISKDGGTTFEKREVSVCEYKYQ